MRATASTSGTRDRKPMPNIRNTRPNAAQSSIQQIIVLNSRSLLGEGQLSAILLRQSAVAPRSYALKFGECTASRRNIDRDETLTGRGMVLALAGRRIGTAGEAHSRFRLAHVGMVQQSLRTLLVEQNVRTWYAPPPVARTL